MLHKTKTNCVLGSMEPAFQNSGSLWIHWTLHTPGRLLWIPCTPQSSTCTLHTAHWNCALHAAHCTLHTEHCKLHTAHCTLHTAHFPSICGDLTWLFVVWGGDDCSRDVDTAAPLVVTAAPNRLQIFTITQPLNSWPLNRAEQILAEQIQSVVRQIQDFLGEIHAVLAQIQPILGQILAILAQIHFFFYRSRLL